MTDKHLTQPPAGEFVMFASDDGEVRVECRFEHETLWLPQATIANLYQVTPQAITQHIKAIYEEGELEQSATCKSYLQVQREGTRQVSRNMLHYSLPVIIAVGYRRFTTVENRHQQVAFMPPISTSKIIWGHNRGHGSKLDKIKISKFNSNGYQVRLL